MINFAELRSVAFEWISKSESVRILSLQERQKLQLHEFAEVWEVTTEIYNVSGQIEITTFNLAIPRDFPLLVPRVYLTPDSFNKYKHLPHTQPDYFICTFKDDAQANINFPGQVVELVLRKAKRIIEDGLASRNEADYEDEFSAYWALSYSRRDQPKETVLSVLDGPIGNTFKLILLDKPIGKFSEVIHQQGAEALRFIDYLKENQHKYKEYEGINVGAIPITKPPFEYSNKQTFELIQKYDAQVHEELIRFINKQPSPIYLLFSKQINGLTRYFGWRYGAANLNRNGFRNGKIKPFQALSTYQAADLVTRIVLEDFSSSRLSARTAGSISAAEHCFVVVGVGSVGSNLTPFLISIQNTRLKLIDDESLRVENIGRHLLGLSDVGLFKTRGVRSHLLRNRPTLDVNTKEESILTVLQNEISFISDSTYLFLAIGNTSIERYISSILREKASELPMFIFWVEPYLAAGHCIFLDPGGATFDAFFDEQDLFRGNLIAKTEYIGKNPLLSKKEAGCQTSYVPYSSSDMLAFLGSLFPFILNIIRSSQKGTRSFSWVGDLVTVEQMGLEIAAEFRSNAYGTIIESRA